MNISLPRLILIADGFATQNLLDKIDEAIGAGIKWVHLRDHKADYDVFSERAEFYIRQSPSIIRYTINRRLYEARSLNCHFHTSKRGPSVREARNELGDSKLIGYSAHTLPEAQQAKEDGADYIFFSPIFPTPSKPNHPGIGLDALSHVCKELAPLPVYALGGITPDRVQSCFMAGAYGVATLSGILGKRTPSVPGGTSPPLKNGRGC